MCYIITLMNNTAYFPNKYLSKISLILLMACLCSFASHAQHVDLVLDFNETQQCPLCQNIIDSPPDLLLSVLPQSICYDFLVNPVVSCCFTPSAYPRPPLRAPPLY